MKKYLLFILIALFVSCKKYRHNYIKGKVIEEGSEQPVENATVILQYWNPKHGNAPYNYDSVYTDTNGEFTFYRRKKIGWEYHLWARENNHTTRSKNNITKETPPLLVYLDAMAYLRIRVQKTAGSNKTIYVNVNNSAYYNFTSISAFDSIKTPFPVGAEQSINISWSITDPSAPAGPANPLNLNGSVSVSKNDTLIYLIQYN